MCICIHIHIYIERERDIHIYIYDVVFCQCIVCASLLIVFTRVV